MAKTCYIPTDHGFLGVLRRVRPWGSYDMIEKPAIFPHISWILGDYQEGFWLWYHNYYTTPFFYDIVYDIAYDMPCHTI
jgi:hypothetical protein